MSDQVQSSDAPPATSNAGELTRLLDAWQQGEPGARDRLLDLAYAELRRLAAQRLAGRVAALDPTELVHELMLRLLREPPRARDRGHFFRIAALAFRQILIDQARRAQAQRRQGESAAITLSGIASPICGASVERWLDIEAALVELEAADERKARICELVLLLGIPQAEAAQALEISVATLERELRFLRAWLTERLAP